MSPRAVPHRTTLPPAHKLPILEAGFTARTSLMFSFVYWAVTLCLDALHTLFHSPWHTAHLNKLSQSQRSDDGGCLRSEIYHHIPHNSSNLSLSCTISSPLFLTCLSAPQFICLILPSLPRCADTHTNTHTHIDFSSRAQCDMLTA